MDERASDLPRSIGSEVEENKGVTILDLTHRLAIGVHDHGRLDELVTLVRCVAGLDRLRGAPRLLTFAEHVRFVRALGALPAVVAVHGVIAANYRPDPTDSNSRDLLFQLLQICGSAARWGVASVHNRVHHDLVWREVLLFGHLEQRE